MSPKTILSKPNIKDRTLTELTYILKVEWNKTSSRQTAQGAGGCGVRSPPASRWTTHC